MLFCLFVLGSNLTLESFPTLLIGSFSFFFFDVTNFFEQYEKFFRKLESLLEVQRAEGRFSDNPVHKTLEL